MQKYTVNQHLIETILAWVHSGEIAIPEIQRPFVWSTSKVRDLMDSLYKGFPIGYIIAWQNPNVRLKDGSLSSGKKILIDGQQRVTALTAALLGQYVVNKNYERIKIKIAFNPLEERFEVQNPAILKDKVWLHDIAAVIDGDLFEIAEQYFDLNPEVDKKAVRTAMTNLKNIPKKQIGLIELAPELDIETVTEIFIRINSAGVVLSQADFAMSKIAADTSNGGQNLRKAIDYFCHLAVAPEYFTAIRDNDVEFSKTDYFDKMRWLKDELDDLFDPGYTDMLRVAFGLEFQRGKLSDLVSLLSGRNFETRTFDEEIATTSFLKLKEGVLKFMNETNFKRFVMIIKSAGFIVPQMIRSKNALNFAYVVYLYLRDKKLAPAKIESLTKRWFVMSILTGRSTGSFESQFDYDLRQMRERPDFEAYLVELESSQLSEVFWKVGLPQNLESSVSSSPYFYTYLASQIQGGDKGFLSKDVTVRDLVMHRGDIHHIFPKDYLKKAGRTRGSYNQIANYVYMQSEINIQVGNKSPKVYFAEIKEQVQGGELRFGGIQTKTALSDNLKQNCIPESIFNLDIDDYDDFLLERRGLMAEKIRGWYLGL